ncbi:mucin-5AC-like [Rhagoletis pomonella]|uniref:mucin-5AC-like n=1 Tax=Rhagoletis pomonella TaxID=28610 RepID=UPI00178018BA|nr:mucin-5AC-like [Rhagoletis pomonella]
MEPKDIAAMETVPFLSASTDNVSVAKALHDKTTNSITTRTTTAVTPKIVSSAPPVLSLISSTTSANIPDTTTVVDTTISSPSFHAPSHPHSPLSLTPTPQTTSNSLPTFTVTTIFPSGDLPRELFTIEAIIATTTADNNAESASVALQRPPPSDVLLKGFSIPTFLPPFPAFAMADLPSYTMTPTSAPAAELADSQNQLYLAAYQQNAPLHNLSMPAVNITVQMGNHAYLPCKAIREVELEIVTKVLENWDSSMRYCEGSRGHMNEILFHK